MLKFKPVNKLILLLLFFSNSAFSESAIDRQNRIDKERAAKYYPWLEKATDQEKIYIKRNTIACDERKDVSYIFQYINRNYSGHYSSDLISEVYDSCFAVSGGAIGKIIERKKGSDIVKVLYAKPFSNRTPTSKKQVVEYYMYLGQLETVKQAKKVLVK